MKHIKSIFALLLLGISATASAQQIVFHKADGTQMKFHVSEFDSISIHNQDWIDPTGTPNRMPVSINATIGEGGSTRVGMHKVQFGSGTTKDMNWQSEDKITILYGTSTGTLTLQDGAETPNGTFKGTVTGTPENVYAIYPQTNSLTLSGNTIAGIALPTYQTAIEDGIDPKAGLMVSYAEKIEGETTSMSFKNLCSYIAVTPSVNLSKIIIQSNGEEKMSGSGMKTTYNNSVTDITYETDKGVNFVCLSGTITAGKTYYLALKPETYANGISMTFVEANGTSSTKNIESSVTVSRSKYYTISNPSESYTAKIVDLGLSGENVETYWALSNVGAGIPQDCGGYYAWGETATKTSYSFMTYSTDLCYRLFTEPNFTSTWSQFLKKYVAKYNTQSGEIGDNKTTLESEDDVATKVKGSSWKMPSKETIEALLTCPQEYTSNYKGSGVTGMIFYHKSYNSEGTNLTDGVVNTSTASETSGQDITHIFLPFGGYEDDSNSSAPVNPNSSHGYYWSNTVCPTECVPSGQTAKNYNYAQAYDLVLTHDNTEGAKAKLSSDFRRGGQNVRAVYVGSDASEKAMTVITQ